MLNSHDIEDMRPDEPETPVCKKCEGKGWIFRGFGEDSECEVCCDKEPK